VLGHGLLKLGYDGPAPEGSDPVPENIDWNLWLGTSPERVL